MKVPWSSKPYIWSVYDNVTTHNSLECAGDPGAEIDQEYLFMETPRIFVLLQ